ncbi:MULTISPECIES: DUF3649 domain-containing protein [unclassified Lysobacter]|uniref:DUF3649 domain-containing protein n=1 Tax=unclassified Lysobacter TaxID=2635362 RepID=UPI001BE687C1|nr:MULTISPECIES: DUF3649 domain-containing protein [unclassified Lysobacter]MBT2745485.1 hypothetical protein [Lysobacter sp. ISL-42]MBT2777027.1 hypothetical protein [Lysobacter sp. ISL-54]MBT2781547.1 hypothetical protein [Lysobacter sp. ISL-52]
MTDTLANPAAAPASRGARTHVSQRTHANASSAGASAPARKPRAKLSWRYRGAVAVRAIAASVIGYLVAYGFTAFGTLVLPFARSDRVVAASLLCFFVWCAAAMYAFAARSAWRACWVLTLWAAAMYGIAALFPEAAARP